VVRGISIAVGMPARSWASASACNGMGRRLDSLSSWVCHRRRIPVGVDHMARREPGWLKAARLAARKIAIVPQGRRLFPSLTVTEHLTMLKSVRARTGWTVDRVFGIFPRLAERRHHRGGQLSGGERGMLAVGRALYDRSAIDPDGRAFGRSGTRHGAASGRDRASISGAKACRSCWSSKTSIAPLAVADRVYILETGQVVHQGDAAALAQQTDLLFQRLGVQ